MKYRETIPVHSENFITIYVCIVWEKNRIFNIIEYGTKSNQFSLNLKGKNCREEERRHKNVSPRRKIKKTFSFCKNYYLVLSDKGRWEGGSQGTYGAHKKCTKILVKVSDGT